MSTEAADHTPRHLGAAFVFQFVTSLAAGLLSASLLAGRTSEILRDISRSPGRMQAAIVLEAVFLTVKTLALYALVDANAVPSAVNRTTPVT